MKRAVLWRLSLEWRQVSDMIAASAVSLTRFAGAGLAFGLLTLVSIQLGPANAGTFFVSTTWAFGLAIVARWGASDVLLISLAPLGAGWRRQAAPAMLAYQLRAALLRTTALLLSAAAAYWLLSSDWHVTKLGIDPVFLMVLTPLTVVQQLLAAASKSLGKPVTASLLEYCVANAIAMLVYPLHWLFGLKLTLSQLEIVYLAGTATSVCALIVFGVGRIPLRRPISVRVIGALNRRAKNFALIEITGYLATWSSLIMMPLLLTARDVGIFNGAMRLAGLVSLIAVSIPTVLVPQLSIAWRAGDDASFRKLLKTMWLVMLAVGSIYYLGLVLFGRFTLRLFGHAFVEGYGPLLVVAAGLCGSLCLGPAGAALNVRGRERASRNISVVTGIATALATLPLVHFFGMMGAACITGFSAIASKAALLIVLWQDFVRPCPPHPGAGSVSTDVPDASCSK